ncbi:MAG: ATP-dependent Clp protease ATP-binding subunit [Candidatus Paceibacterota bacterium]|jgi:ATP-dependent Clp protease ATP-binding subunit ClpC
MALEKKETKEKKEKKIPIELLECSDCKGNKVTENQVDCPTCNGLGVFLRVGKGAVYYWSHDISGISPMLRKAVNIIPMVLKMVIIFASIAYFLLGMSFVVRMNPHFLYILRDDIMSEETGWILTDYFLAILKTIDHTAGAFNVLFTENGSGPLYFWLSIFGAMVIYYLHRIRNVARKEIDPKSQDFEVFYERKGMLPKNPVNVAEYFSPLAQKTLIATLDLAHGKKQAPSCYHLAKIIAENPLTNAIFKRLEVDTKKFVSDMEKMMESLPKNDYYEQDGILQGTVMSPDLERFTLIAFWETMIVGLPQVEPESLFLSILSDDSIKKYFNDMKIEVDDIRNTVVWVKGWSGIRVALKRPRRVKHVVMNRAWTSRVTPELDKFSYDLTDHARVGLIGYVVDRDKELDNLMRILERTSQNNALLIGEQGCGRTSIVKKLATRMVKDQVLPTLKDKRLVVLDIGALVSGAKAGGDLEQRIRKLLEDMGKSGNIILYIPDIHNMAAAGSGQGFDASKVLSPILAQGIFQIIGSTDYRNYHKYIEPRADFANNFDMIKVEELDEKNTMEVLALQAKIIEAREGIVMTYGAIKKATELSKRYITDRLLPGKAIDLLSETAVEVRRRGPGSILRDKDIMEVITDKTGIPLTDINATEAEKLLGLEEKLHGRVIGQSDAVKAVASAIRRVRVGIKQENRPIGTFLFLGPTGVGKTELAKALAEAYYGDDSAMIRLDMSEYQTVGSVEKLIGSSSDLTEASSGGILTEAVKRKPFSLILLDELEKADKNVLNLFLQVFDDGRLTDNLGRTVDFTNSIIIATSNAGSKVISKIVVDEGSSNERMLQMLEPYLLQYFAPEFLNRFTARIIFRSLSREDVVFITKLQLDGLAKRLEKAQGIKFIASLEAIAKLSTAGYSPEYGARFLQRTIQEKVENLIAVKFLKGEIRRGDVFEIKEQDV